MIYRIIVVNLIILFFLGCSSPEKKLINTKWVNVSIDDMKSPFLFEFGKNKLQITYFDKTSSFGWEIEDDIVSINGNNFIIDNIRVFKDSLIVKSKESDFKLIRLNELVKKSDLNFKDIDLVKGIWDIESDFINHSKSLEVSYLDFLIDGTALWVYGKNERKFNSQIINWELFNVKGLSYLKIEGIEDNFILITSVKENYLGGIFLGSDFGLEHNLIRQETNSEISDVLALINGSWSIQSKNQELLCEGIDLVFESGLGGLYTIYYDVDNLDIEGGDYILSEDLNYLLFNNPDREKPYPVKIEFVTRDSIRLNFQYKEQIYTFYKDNSMDL